jgi:hypothetical protein
MDGQQSSLSVIFETVRFPLQYRLFWLLGECVTYQGFEANLQGRKTIVKIRDFRKARKNSPLESLCLWSPYKSHSAVNHPHYGPCQSKRPFGVSTFDCRKTLVEI